MAIGRRISMTVCCTALLMACSIGRLHASCANALQDEGRVNAVLDARTFRLDDGREVRLVGIELPDEIAMRSPDTLSSLIGGREITLHGSDDKPDRYGRIGHMYAFTHGAANMWCTIRAEFESETVTAGLV